MGIVPPHCFDMKFSLKASSTYFFFKHNLNCSGLWWVCFRVSTTYVPDVVLDWPLCSHQQAGKTKQSSGGHQQWKVPWLWRGTKPYRREKFTSSLSWIFMKDFFCFFIYLEVLGEILWSLSTTDRSTLLIPTSVDTFTFSCKHIIITITTPQ